MTSDPLFEIKADLETGRDISSDQQRWLVSEIERLRVKAGEASPREILGLPDD